MLRRSHSLPASSILHNEHGQPDTTQVPPPHTLSRSGFSASCGLPHRSGCQAIKLLLEDFSPPTQRPRRVVHLSQNLTRRQHIKGRVPDICSQIDTPSHAPHTILPLSIL